MAFIEDGFSPVGGHHASRLADALEGFAEFSYKTEDGLGTFVANGYFNDLRDDVKVGDVIHVSGNLDAVNSTDFDFDIIYFDVVPASPLTTDVEINTLRITASPE